MHCTALVAIDDDRGLAEIGSAKVARARDFDIEREKAPRLTAKDAVLLLLIELGTSSLGQSAAFRNKKIREIDEIPEGRANLIRASFRAGVRPATIARTFRISQSFGQPRSELDREAKAIG
jgi:hypothetical protein